MIYLKAEHPFNTLDEILGDSIDAATSLSIALNRQIGVTFEFNGVTVRCRPGDSPGKIVTKYQKDLMQKRGDEEASKRPWWKRLREYLQ